MPPPDSDRVNWTATPTEARFVSFGAGDASRQLTVVNTGDHQLLLIAAISGVAEAGTRTCTYGGVPLVAVAPHNDYVQMFAMLDPPIGTAALVVTPTGISTVIDAQYASVEAFQSGQQASLANDVFNLLTNGLVVFGMSAVTVAHAAISGTTERVDFGGNWYGDAIVTTPGAVTVGAVSATDPDYAGAVFAAPAATGRPYLTAPDGTPIDLTPGATLPQTIVQSQRIGVMTWANPPIPEPL